MKTCLLPAFLTLASGALLPSCVVTPEAMDALAAASSRPTYYPPPMAHPYRATSDYYASGY